MNECKKCMLSDNIPSVKIDENGECNYCSQKKHITSKINDLNALDQEKSFMNQCEKYSDRQYQVALAYSGGKDSTYTLYLLRKKYKLSVLAITLDNGFLTEQSYKNIRTMTTKLETDSLIVRYSFPHMAKLFNFAANNDVFPPKALERASSICTACIGMVKFAMYRESILRKIPFISFGWTSGQIGMRNAVVRLNHKMILANQQQIARPIIKSLGEEYKKYFIDNEWLEDRADDVPHLFYPFIFNEYDEKNVIDTIKGYGWSRPQDTDSNSTNCLLNSYANDMHIKKYGFNPYAMEIAGMIREGLMSKEEGLKKMNSSGMESTIKSVKDTLEKYKEDCEEPCGKENFGRDLL